MSTKSFYQVLNSCYKHIISLLCNTIQKHLIIIYWKQKDTLNREMLQISNIHYHLDETNTQISMLKIIEAEQNLAINSKIKFDWSKTDPIHIQIYVHTENKTTQMQKKNTKQIIPMKIQYWFSWISMKYVCLFSSSPFWH